MNGATMQRLIGMTLATFAFSSLGGAPLGTRSGELAGRVDTRSVDVRSAAAPIDVTALLTAARGAPPMICSRSWFAICT